jgi:crotonobetainyl-CoA:carnitine CoA-transferase CaiB-like acyl-CoA transferase
MTGGPLDGIVVVEVGNFMAAPFATMQLADLGATVYKVESPQSGDPVRATGPFLAGHSSPFARLNRNKRSVALDLKDPGGRSAFLRLLAGADVLVENLRPGAMRRLELHYDAVREENPRLVYASASGWGQDGPLADRPGLDIMAQARSGLMSITGAPGGDPVKAGVPVCDLVCALYVTNGVLAALHERHTSGEGQYLDVSLLEAGVSFAVWEAGKYFATGEVPEPLGSAHQSTAPYQALRTKDGWVTVGAVTPRTWTEFCRALGLEQLLEDDRYATASTRHVHRDSLIPAIEEVTTTLTQSEVVGALDPAGVPCAPISRYDEVFSSDHLLARDYFWDAEHPEAGPVRQLGSPMRLSRTPARRGTAGPLLGADTRQALTGAGLSATEVDDLVRSGAAGTTDPSQT